MDSDDTAAELRELINTWYAQRWSTFWTKKQRFEPVEVPQELTRTITSVEPYRQQVLQDATVYLSLFCPLGLGPEIEVQPFTLQPEAGWTRAVRSLTFSVRTSDTMEVSSPTSTLKETWDLVVHEDGHWKIAGLWSEATRGSVLAEAEFIKQAWAQRNLK